MLCSKSVWQLSKTVQMPQSAGGASPTGEWRLFLNETYSTRIPFFSAFRAIRLCSRHLMPGINQHHHLGYSLQPLPADDGGGFGMQHFHPGLLLSQLSDVPPYAGPAAKKIRAWCDKTDDVSASPHSFAPLC